MNTIGSRPVRRGRVAVSAVPASDRGTVLPLMALLMGLFLTLSVVAIGCGSDEGTSGTTAGSSSGDGGLTVRMVDNTFEPETITVTVGSAVTWVNEDSVNHNAVADDESWGTEIFGEGGSVSLTFDTPGTYTYNCTLHAGMVGTVVVE